MPSKDGEKLTSIEDLKNKLFSKSYQVKIEHRDSFSHIPEKNVSDSWQDEPGKENWADKIFMKTSVFKKFFLASLAFFVLALGYASYMFFAKGNTVSNDNIDIAVLGNTFTAGGDELSLIIEITNKNNLPLELVDLIVEYPKGSEDGSPDDTERIRESLGTIPSGEVRSENVKMILFGEQGSIQPVKISVEYRVEGSNAIFVKDKLFEVSINSTPLDISVTGPGSATPNQDLVFNIKSVLNATKPVPKVLLRVDYPVGFQFTSAKPEPAFGNNIWEMGDLSPGALQNILIVGKMLDVFDGEEKTFRILSGSQSLSDKSAIDVVLNSTKYIVGIKKPLIDAELFINGESGREFSVGSKNTVMGQIRWKNNLETKVNDVQIKAKILGNALNRNTVNTHSGFYNSSENAIIWDKNSLSTLKEINPGESGSLDFSFSTLSLFSASGGMISSPSVNIDVTISGKQPLDEFDTEDLSNQDSAVVKVISDVGFAAKALYYSGPFKNSGAIPPKAEKTTSYTIVWTLSNTSNPISKGKVIATLPSWITFTGSSSPEGEDLIYNKPTRELVWNVGNIPKGAGINVASREVSFQVSFLPSLSQVNTAPDLINEAVLTGHDDFANVDIKVSKPSLNIRLSNDPAFPTGGDRVVE